jgi:hypothetical protein
MVMLIPAVQASRESARRAQCLANIKQLCLALHSYHEQHRLLPPGAIWAPPGEPLGSGRIPIGVLDHVTVEATFVDDRMFANWLMLLLPNLEEQNLQIPSNPGMPIGHPDNEALRATDLEVLKCPSDSFNGANNHFQRCTGAIDRGYARGNYAMNCGTNQNCLTGVTHNCKDGYSFLGLDLARDNSQLWGSGIGGVNRAFSLRQFPGGASHVVAVEEIRAGLSTSDRRGVWSLGYVGSSATGAHGAFGNRGPNRGADLIQGCSVLSMDSGIVLEEENMQCKSSRFEISERATARSQHPGGVVISLADGSAHFVSNEINVNAWHVMHRRDNQSSLPIQAY